MNAAIAEVLGIGSRGPASALAVVNEIDRGLSLDALDRVAHCLSPEDRSFVFRLVPRATLARRRRAGADSRLSPEEGAKIARLADIWDFARDVWGSDEEARAFLFRKHPLLEGRQPIDVVLANEFGHPVVKDILGRLKYGTGV